MPCQNRRDTMTLTLREVSIRPLPLPIGKLGETSWLQLHGRRQVRRYPSPPYQSLFSSRLLLPRFRISYHPRKALTQDWKMLKAECGCRDKAKPLVIYSESHRGGMPRTRPLLARLANISLHPAARISPFECFTPARTGRFNRVRGNWLTK